MRLAAAEEVQMKGSGEICAQFVCLDEIFTEFDAAAARNKSKLGAPGLLSSPK
jgi:hypothetical protein